MAVLRIENLEKQSEDVIIFPKFSLEIAEGQSAAIHSTTNVRSALLDMMVGKVEILSGKITVNQQKVPQRKMDYHSQIGYSFLDDALYERLTVMEHCKFYKRLYESDQFIEDILDMLQLATYQHEKARNLSYSKKKRIQIAHLIFQDPALFVFEEPDQNVDVETKRILLRVFKTLQQSRKSIFVLTGNMESAITLTNDIYRLDEMGLHSIQAETSPQDKIPPKNDDPLVEADIDPIQFNKIPTKVNEKMVLFDPQEIDYVESFSGQSHVYSMGENFPCFFTLTELEERLKPYGFFRCHRSYIVNLQQVREVVTWTRNSYSLMLEDQNKSVIPLSKTKMGELKVMLGIK
ncbi:LytTR family transcriptional regulator DNA-binding domain-containing protein [Virgibacillus doumboii]|uniref:LytTR family transcriptional regulator DNA-binding domain-containing protein n=1 Tax=Virgibacillus doumboii TaxID=2697503 RepID=UPI0013DF7A9E|nr:LytTR family transcriptional regulator DNA-binding domain-containing protein [Virgibacillus doumboii]